MSVLAPLGGPPGTWEPAASGPVLCDLAPTPAQGRALRVDGSGATPPWHLLCPAARSKLGVVGEALPPASPGAGGLGRTPAPRGECRGAGWPRDLSKGTRMSTWRPVFLPRLTRRPQSWGALRWGPLVFRDGFGLCCRTAGWASRRTLITQGRLPGPSPQGCHRLRTQGRRAPRTAPVLQTRRLRPWEATAQPRGDSPAWLPSCSFRRWEGVRRAPPCGDLAAGPPQGPVPWGQAAWAAERPGLRLRDGLGLPLPAQGRGGALPGSPGWRWTPPHARRP